MREIPEHMKHCNSTKHSCGFFVWGDIWLVSPPQYLGCDQAFCCSCFVRVSAPVLVGGRAAFRTAGRGKGPALRLCLWLLRPPEVIAPGAGSLSSLYCLSEALAEVLFSELLLWGQGAPLSGAFWSPRLSRLSERNCFSLPPAPRRDLSTAADWVSRQDHAVSGGRAPPAVVWGVQTPSPPVLLKRLSVGFYFYPSSCLCVSMQKFDEVF